MGSAKSNPIAHKLFNMYNTQLNAWKYNYDAHEMQCMKFLGSNFQKLSQNFINNSSILKNPKNFQEPQNLGFKTWNACKWRRLQAYQMKENLKKLEESLGKGLEWEREV